MIICFPAPEIWHMTNVIIFHFGHFFALLHPPPPPPNNPKNENEKKMKKKNLPGDIVIEQCTKNVIICYTVPEILHATD